MHALSLTDDEFRPVQPLVLHRLVQINPVAVGPNRLLRRVQELGTESPDLLQNVRQRRLLALSRPAIATSSGTPTGITAKATPAAGRPGCTEAYVRSDA